MDTGPQRWGKPLFSILSTEDNVNMKGQVGGWHPSLLAHNHSVRKSIRRPSGTRVVEGGGGPVVVTTGYCPASLRD